MEESAFAYKRGSVEKNQEGSRVEKKKLEARNNDQLWETEIISGKVVVRKWGTI